MKKMRHPKQITVKTKGGKRTIAIFYNVRLPWFKVHEYIEEFNKKYDGHLQLLSQKTADLLLNDPYAWKAFVTGKQSIGEVHVDTLIAYEKPGVKFGKEVVFNFPGEPQVVLKTGKYEGKEGALVAVGLSAKDFRKKGRIITVSISDKRLMLVRNFPKENPKKTSHYAVHKKTGIPQDTTVPPSPKSRCIYRIESSSYVGPLVYYGVDPEGGGGQVLEAFTVPSKKCWTIVAEIRKRQLLPQLIH